MPSEFGPWKTVFNRFDRWSKNGWWSELLVALQTDIDDEWQCIDSTTNRAHQHAAGGRGGPAFTAGRSRGGLTTKVHVIVDALGLPLAFEVTEGQRHDLVPAPDLVQRTRPRRLLADKAYSSHEFRAILAKIGCEPVIPSSGSWIDAPSYDKDVYRARSEVECTFNLLKQARRFATRYEKTLRNYAAVVAIGCALLWLRI
jgi:transposase